MLAIVNNTAVMMGGADTFLSECFCDFLLFIYFSYEVLHALSLPCSVVLKSILPLDLKFVL